MQIKRFTIYLYSIFFWERNIMMQEIPPVVFSTANTAQQTPTVYRNLHKFLKNCPNFTESGISIY